MIASLNLLKQFVDLSDISVDELVHKLTFSGFEVEGVKPLAKASNIVIGQILSVENHPDSDHLHILNVDQGEVYGVHQIVCGAPNVRVGMKIIVARIGAKLGFNDFEIKPSKIRGVESNGMCCSLSELGVEKSLLSEKQLNGIEELNDDAIVGNENVLEYLGLDDVLIDINVLANRSDVLSIYSLAREVGALLNRKVTIPEYNIVSNSDCSFTPGSNSEFCKQFAIRGVKNLTVKKSPEFLVRALRSAGIRSINNIVDIGNYVMLLTGRPLHMYDMDKITDNNKSEQTIIVRDDLECDFVALDDNTYKLEKGDLVVTDGSNPLCLGGIMGSKSSQVDENTKNVLIEVATFAPFKVRRTSSRIGLSSDSSSRFVKGIHPSNQKETLELASYLLKEYAGATTFEEIKDYDVREEVNREIPCSYSYINHRLGTELTSKEMDEVFASLDIEIKHINDDEFVAIPPAHRIDLKLDADLSEEIFRTIGLNMIKPVLPVSQMTIGKLNEFQRRKRVIREHLISSSLTETLTYTLVSPLQSEELVSLSKNDTCYFIKNPMTQDHSVVRKSVLRSLINVLIYNNAHQNNDVAIFETTSIETKEDSYTSLGIVLSGKKKIQGSLASREYDFYDIAGLFTSILNILGVQSNRIRVVRSEAKFYHPGRSVDVYMGKTKVCSYGELHPSVIKELGIAKTYTLEMNLDAFINLKSSQLKMSQFSKFPSVNRDYAFVMKKEIPYGDILNAVKKNSSGIITNCDVFDVYIGEHVAPGFKSVAISLSYSSLDHTLKDVEINEAEAKALKAITSLGAELRK